MKNYINLGYYVSAEIISKGVNFLMLPFLTHSMSMEEFGSIAVVVSITAIASIFFTFSLQSSALRFYYDYINDPKKLERLWGTILVAILILSTFFLALFFSTANFYSSLLGEVPFFPLVGLSLLSVAMSSVFMLFQSTIRAREDGGRYLKQHLFRITVYIAAVIYLIFYESMGALGIILATFIAEFVMFVYTVIIFGRELQWCLDFKMLKHASKYSVQFLPHNISGIILVYADRLVINKVMSVGDVAIYNIALSFAMIIGMLTSGANEAFQPRAMRAIKEGKTDKLISFAKNLIYIYAAAAILLSLFIVDVINLLFPVSYKGAAFLVPILLMTELLRGYYRIYSAPLFYDLKGPSFISAITFIMAMIYIPVVYAGATFGGLQGVVYSTVVIEGFVTLLVYNIAKRRLYVPWDNAPMLIALFCMVIISVLIIEVEIQLWLRMILAVITVLFIAYQLRNFREYWWKKTIGNE
jgi:O-antigen/teichoic acid export membrane protein